MTELTKLKLVIAFAVASSLFACGTTVPLTTTVNDQGDVGRLTQGGMSDGAGTPLDGGPVEGPDSSVRASGATGTSRGAGRTGGSGQPGPSGPTGGGGGESVAASGGPVKVGILLHDFTALVKSVGGSSSNTDMNAIVRALIKGLNAQGGLAGRQIEPVFYTVDGSASDYSSQYQAACDTFTRDNRVEVVVGGSAADLLYSCLLKAGIALLAGNPTEGTDREGMAKFPNVFNPPGMATDRQALTLIEQSVANGWLTSKNKLGVVVSGCDWGSRVYTKVIAPAARKHGVPVEHFSLGCPAAGSASLGETSGSVQSASLQFRGNGVDRVMFAAGHQDAASYVFFTKNADSQRWFPGYLVGTNAVVQGWTASGVVTREQAANTKGTGWVPVVDSLNPPDTPQTRACVDIARAGGAPPPPDQPTAGKYYMMCDAFLPLRAGMEATRGVTRLPTLRAALEGLGSSYSGAAVVGGSVLLGPDRHDGARSAAFFTYRSDCGCFGYAGKPQPA